MKRTVLTFGLIAGAILSVMMLGTIPFHERLGFDTMEIVGYTTMIMAFLLVFFGIRSYRDNVGNGLVTFGRAFKVGALIVAVASVCYVTTWQVIYAQMTPDFYEKLAAHTLEKKRASGASEQELAEMTAQNEKFSALYRNPAIRVAVTFMEIMPIGLIVAGVSAAILRRKRVDALREAVLV